MIIGIDSSYQSISLHLLLQISIRSMHNPQLKLTCVNHIIDSLNVYYEETYKSMLKITEKSQIQYLFTHFDMILQDCHELAGDEDITDELKIFLDNYCDCHMLLVIQQ